VFILDKVARSVLLTLLNRRCIGGKHTSEDAVIKQKTKWLNKSEFKEFEFEYTQLIRNEILIRLKKRTGKSADWHISINPRKLGEVGILLELADKTVNEGATTGDEK